ncbi:MAG: glycosyltransferase family A protein [Anaerolineales bacterium]|jgi:glycosyltransferase involved in cell wall biosynthesis
MSSKSLVSVIIIFLNAESFIQEAVESVFAQTYKKWEILLIDDGSTDSSTKVALRYEAQNPGQVRYLEHLNHQNLGMSASRNLGIQNSQGDYVAFLDADDVWLPHKLERQVAILNSQPEAAMLYGNALYWYSWTGNPKDYQRDHKPDLGVQPNSLIEPPNLLPLYLKGAAAVPCPCSVLVRRHALDRIGGFEESFPGMYEDQAFYAKMALANSIFVSEECLELYRQHPDASTAIANRMGQEVNARQFFLQWLKRYLVEKGIKDPKVCQVLNRELWRLAHPARLPTSENIRYLVRWTKKWLLKIEERILPAAIRHWLWY